MIIYIILYIRDHPVDTRKLFNFINLLKKRSKNIA